jgi:nucleoid-associated protein YgaU
LRLHWIFQAASVLAVAASIQGCGKPVLRIADASLGDYYTDKEFRKLSAEQRAEYCAELARQDSIYKSEMAEIRDQLDQSQARSLHLRAEGDSLFALGTALEKEGPRAHRRAPGTQASHGQRHVVRPGESLWRISARPGVFGTGFRWHDLYAANRARIPNPDLIYPGQELTIPR